MTGGPTGGGVNGGGAGAGVGAGVVHVPDDILRVISSPVRGSPSNAFQPVGFKISSNLATFKVSI